jgi:diguanylate cyclase (GGDEF)-like protein
MERTKAATTTAERISCHASIERAIAATAGPVDAARLLLCRSYMHDRLGQKRSALQDALAAMDLFDEAEDLSGALDAASAGAAVAAVLGEISLAVELAKRCVVDVGLLTEDWVVADVANQLSIFCHSLLDHDRATEQLEISLAAAERCKDVRRTCRALHNLVEYLLFAIWQDRACGDGDGLYDRFGADRLARANAAFRRFVEVAPPEFKAEVGTQRLQAELLVERGAPARALQVLREATHDDGSITFFQGQHDLARVEARCLRALGRPAEAVAAAERAAELCESSGDHQLLMAVLDELIGATTEAGRFEVALAHSQELRRRFWTVQRRQARQLVDQVWAHAETEEERRSLRAQTAAAVRSSEEDELTRLGNRRLLERILGLASVREPITLFMADVDRFKLINDTFGHQTGDRVLQAVGAILSNDARVGQVAVRYGGEEFVLAMPSVGLEAAADLAERIRLKVKSFPWETLSGGLEVTVSIGIACGTVSGWRSVLAHADRAMYLAKERGRDRVVISGV